MEVHGDLKSPPETNIAEWINVAWRVEDKGDFESPLGERRDSGLRERGMGQGEAFI